MADDISFRMDGDISPAEAKLNSLPDLAGRALNAVQTAFGAATTGSDAFATSLAAASISAVAVQHAVEAAVTPLVDFAGATLKVAGEFEQSSIAFKTMLGSASAAQAHLESLRDFAQRTPFEFPDLVTASKRLQAIGFAAQEVIPTLTAVGNAASALGSGSVGIERITTALGQMSAKGKVQAEEMRQLAEAAIPAWDILAKTLGTDVAGAMAAVEKRTVDASVAIPALIEGINKRFGGLMEAQSKSLLGMWSNFKDAITVLMTDIGNEIMPLAKAMIAAGAPLLQWVSDLVKGFSMLPEPIKFAVVAVGGLTVALSVLSVAAIGVVAAYTALAPAIATLTGSMGIATAATTTAAIAQTGFAVAEVATTASTVALDAALATGAVQLELFRDETSAAMVQMELFSGAEMQAAVAGDAMSASQTRMGGALSALKSIVGVGILATFAADMVLVSSEAAKTTDDIRKLATTQVDWTRTMKEAGFGIAELVDAIRSVPPADAQVRGSAVSTSKSIIDMEGATIIARKAWSNLSETLYDLRTPLGFTEATLKRIKQTLDDMPKGLDIQVAAPGLPRGLSPDMKTVKYELDEASTAFTNVLAKQREAEKGLETWRGALQKAKDALAAHRITQADYNAVLEEYNKALKKAHEQQDSNVLSLATLERNTAAAGREFAQAQAVYDRAVKAFADGKISLDVLNDAFAQLDSKAKAAGESISTTDHTITAAIDTATKSIQTLNDVAGAYGALRERADGSATTQLAIANAFKSVEAAAKAVGLEVKQVGDGLQFVVPKGAAATDAMRELADQLTALHGAANLTYVNVNGQLVPTLESLASATRDASQAAGGAVEVFRNVAAAAGDTSHDITVLRGATSDYWKSLQDLSTTQVFINGEWVKASEMLKTLAGDFLNTAGAAEQAAAAMKNAQFSADAWESGFGSRSGGGGRPGGGRGGGGIGAADMLSIYATAGASSAQLAQIAQALGLVVLGNNQFASQDYVDSLPTISGGGKYSPGAREGAAAESVDRLAAAAESSAEQLTKLYPEWARFVQDLKATGVDITKMDNAIVSVTPNLDNLANLDLSTVTSEMQSLVTAGGAASAGLAGLAAAVPGLTAAVNTVETGARATFQAMAAMMPAAAPKLGSSSTPNVTPTVLSGPGFQAMSVSIPITVQAGVIAGQGGMNQLANMVGANVIDRLKTNTGLKL